MHCASLTHPFSNMVEAANSCEALHVGLGLDSILSNQNSVSNPLTESDFSIESANQN